MYKSQFIAKNGKYVFDDKDKSRVDGEIQEVGLGEKKRDGLMIQLRKLGSKIWVYVKKVAERSVHRKKQKNNVHK